MSDATLKVQEYLSFRRLSIGVSPELHHKLKIRVAVEDTTMQDFVTRLLEEALKEDTDD